MTRARPDSRTARAPGLDRVSGLLAVAVLAGGALFAPLLWFAGGLLVLLSLWLLLEQRPWPVPEREDRILAYAPLAQFLAVAASVLVVAGPGALVPEAGPWIYLPLAVPVLFGAGRRLEPELLWVGCAAGALLAGLAGLIGPAPAEAAVAGPVLGTLAALLAGSAAAPGPGWRWPLSLLVLLVGALGALLDPGPAWLGLPVLLALVLAARRPGVPRLVLAGLAGLVVLIGLGVRWWLVDLAPSPQVPAAGFGDPWFGRGWNLPPPPEGAGWRHSQYLWTLYNGGLVGLGALLALLLAPLSVFGRAWQSLQPEVRRLGAAGLATVAGYALPALAGPVLATPAAGALYVALLVLLAAALARARSIAPDPDRPRRHSLSAIIITRNEADRIRPCLDSIAGWVDEIVVLDSGSEDATVAICREYTERVEVTDWPGFGPQKQRALERASGDWVLSIDADERVDPRMRDDIVRLLQQAQPAHLGYGARWGVMVAGRRLDFGRSARAPLRLFRRAGARFTDDVVHERIVLPRGAGIGRLDGRLLHYSHRDLGHHLAKVAEYAWLGARRRHDRGRRGGGLALATLRGLWTFCWVYFVRLGLLDGRAGFLVAALYGQTTFNTYAALWSLGRSRTEADRPG